MNPLTLSTDGNPAHYRVSCNEGCLGEGVKYVQENLTKVDLVVCNDRGSALIFHYLWAESGKQIMIIQRPVHAFVPSPHCGSSAIASDEAHKDQWVTKSSQVSQSPPPSPGIA